ncbi:MAG TPA: hypothetical protein VK084_08295 [Chitinophagaceae bacterium]|nr:hypothetical protein [Chitinophagaceae bacterium]
MKKLKLEELNLGYAEVLSREELKKVLGGIGSGGSGGSGTGDVMCCDEYNPSDCGRCMPYDMMSSCPAGQIMGKCVYG